MMLILAGAAVVLLSLIAVQIRRLRREATLARLLETFAPAVAAVQQDPKQLLTWYPLAQVSRKTFAKRSRSSMRPPGEHFHSPGSSCWRLMPVGRLNGWPGNALTMPNTR